MTQKSKIRSPFFAFRYLITPFDNQSSLIHEWEKSKEELMRDAWIDLFTGKKVSYLRGKRKYIFFSVVDFKNRLFGFNFAKEQSGTKYVEGDEEIISVTDQRLKHVLMFVHADYQIILIERKTSAFQKVSSAIRQLEWYLRDRMRTYDYTVNIHPLAKSDRFWEIIESSEGIYELSLTLNAPNLFGGDTDLREALQELKDETNNDETTIEFKSNEGVLKIEKKSFIGRAIEYISKIGGMYRLVAKVDGQKEKRTNLDDTESTKIPKHKNFKYSEEELENIETKMKVIDGRSNNNDNDE